MRVGRSDGLLSGSSARGAGGAQALQDAPAAAPGPGHGPTGAPLDEDRRRITEPSRVGTLFVASGLSFTGYTDGKHREIVDSMLSSGDTEHFDESGLWFVDGRDADDIESYVRSELARHNVHRDVLFVDDLPRNETGTLLRNLLSESIKYLSASRIPHAGGRP